MYVFMDVCYGCMHGCMYVCRYVCMYICTCAFILAMYAGVYIYTCNTYESYTFICINVCMIYNYK